MIEHAVLGFSWTEPDIAALEEWLDRRVDVARMGGGAMLRLQVEHPRPEFAASVVEMMHENADALLRGSALERTGAQISRVERELAAANSPTREQALEEVLLGLAQALAPRRSALRPAQIVVPVTASARPTSPSPLLILALAAMVGAILGIFAVFLRDALRAGGG